MAKDQKLRKARELFFRYDGSRFYMSRDGADRDYLAYAIPKDVEQEWLAELTARHLSWLDKPGNWSTLNFLVHHGQTGYLERVVGTPPLGELWQRISYLEFLLRYVTMCQSAGASADMVARALDVVHDRATELMGRARAEDRRSRIVRVLEETERRKTKLALYLVKQEQRR